jgi:hypothetical protein
VSFIDDFSKFTWICLLKFKSEVFQKFYDFQNLVERLFDQKIISVQTDWGRENEGSILFLPKLASHILFHALMHTNKMGLLNESIATSLK